MKTLDRSSKAVKRQLDSRLSIFWCLVAANDDPSVQILLHCSDQIPVFYLPELFCVLKLFSCLVAKGICDMQYHI